jgi:hypothetical protein
MQIMIRRMWIIHRARLPIFPIFPGNVHAPYPRRPAHDPVLVQRALLSERGLVVHDGGWSSVLSGSRIRFAQSRLSSALPRAFSQANYCAAGSAKRSPSARQSAPRAIHGWHRPAVGEPRHASAAGGRRTAPESVSRRAAGRNPHQRGSSRTLLTGDPDPLSSLPDSPARRWRAWCQKAGATSLIDRGRDTLTVGGPLRPLHSCQAPLSVLVFAGAALHELDEPLPETRLEGSYHP